MLNLKKYGFGLLYSLITILVCSLLINCFYYFDKINPTMYRSLTLIVPLLALMIAGFFVGRRSSKKGWLEGIKVGAIIVVFFFIFSFLAFNQGLSLKQLLFDVILMVSSIFGSMLGINFPKRQN